MKSIGSTSNLCVTNLSDSKIGTIYEGNVHYVTTDFRNQEYPDGNYIPSLEKAIKHRELGY